MRKLDDWLIDRVFQRVADWLVRVSGRCCYWWAAQGFLASILGCVFVGVMDFRAGYIFPVALDALMGWCCYRYARRMIGEAAKGRIAIPLDRLAAVGARCGTLFALAFFFPVTLLDALGGDLRQAIISAQHPIVLVALYLAACVAMRPPPKPVRGAVMDGAR